MSLLEVAEPEAPEPVVAGARRSRATRLWSAPIRFHAAALGLFLVAILAFVGDTTSLTSDSGVAVVQARSVSAGNGWIVEHPFPEVDPDGRHFPIEKSDRGTKGFAPFAKHPLYVVLLAGADRVAGVPGMLGLSLLGTVLAAVLAAGLASRIEPGAARPALWVVGLGSPLLFDGYMVMAHTLAAATAAGTVLVAARAIERRSVPLAAAVGPLVAVAVLLRSEAVFLGLGLAAVTTVVTVRSRPAGPAGPAVTLAGVAVGAAVIARLAENAWIERILGDKTADFVAPFASGSGAYFSERAEGLLMTWFTPSYRAAPSVVLPLLLMLAMTAVAGYCARRRPPAQAVVVFGAVLGSAAAVMAFLAAPDNMVPGLFVAFPIAVVGLLCLTRSELAGLHARLSVGVAAVFAVCVVATQYSVGGGVEWGGRYFALGIPLIVPVLVVAIRRRGCGLRPAVRWTGVVALVVGTLAMTGMAVGSLRAGDRLQAKVLGEIERAGVATGDDRPVVVTTAFSMAALLWPSLDDQRWLFSRAEDLDTLALRMERAGVGRFVLLTYDRSRDESHAAAFQVVASEGNARGTGRQVLVLAR